MAGPMNPFDLRDSFRFGETLIGLPVPAHAVVVDHHDDDHGDHGDEFVEVVDFPVTPRNALFKTLLAQHEQQTILIEETRLQTLSQNRVAEELRQVRQRIPSKEDYREINAAAVSALKESLDGISLGTQREVSRAFAIYITAVNIDGSIDLATRVGRWLAESGERVKQRFDALGDIVTFLTSGKGGRRAAAGIPPIQLLARALLELAKDEPYRDVRLLQQLTANDVLVFLQMADEVQLLLADSQGDVQPPPPVPPAPATG